ncbi:MAG: class I SAM-dependent methyltransferase [Bacteroidia bacterium]
MPQNYIQTAFDYIKHIKVTGAISESSRFVEEEICAYIRPEEAQMIVEFGAGFGNITQEILKRMHPDSKLFSFEIKPEFLEALKLKITDKRVTFISASASDVGKYIEGVPIDAIVSSIPITIIPKEVVTEILDQSQKILKPNGTYSQLIYTPQPQKFKKQFAKTNIKIALNFPIAFIHHAYK